MDMSKEDFTLEINLQAEEEEQEESGGDEKDEKDEEGKEERMSGQDAEDYGFEVENGGDGE